MQHVDKAFRNGFAHWKHALEDDRVAQIVRNQRTLLESGFSLLKPGGTLVYSTCSFSVRQNEDIVQHFLKDRADAQLVPIHLSDDIDQRANNPRLPGTLRFSPQSTQTSGLFIAKLVKRNPLQCAGDTCAS